MVRMVALITINPIKFKIPDNNSLTVKSFFFYCDFFSFYDSAVKYDLDVFHEIHPNTSIVIIIYQVVGGESL